MSKKNLDNIFQEKFEEFSDIPTEKVWKSIESSLNKKKKNRKVIPIWWKLGGIAAALAIGLFLINPFKDNGNETNTIITDVEKVKEEQNETDNSFDQSPLIDETQPQIVESEKSNIPENTKSNGFDSDSDQKNKPQPQSIYNNKANLVENDKGQKSVQEQKPENTQIVVNKNEDDKERSNDRLIEVKEQDKETALAVSESASSAEDPANNMIVVESDNENKGKGNALDNNEEVIVKLSAEDSKEKIEDGKKSIFDEISEQEQEEEVVDAKNNKWSAGPSIAPVYFNAIGDGSPVHSIFVPNSKSGDVNLSYGLVVAYEINKKLSIKTGVHKVDYGYNTNDVEFSATIEGFNNGQIDNIDYSLASRNIVVESKASRSSSFAENAAMDAAAQDPSLLGVMAQQFGYLEIPLELNYALIDNKFGVNLIGGLSSLFLVDNSVSLTSGELITEIGEANNVNNVNFSTNIGFGVNYKFSPKVQLNIEPVFKYQLNTFSDTSGSFQPFTIGVYSGLNFRF